jgi:hypothetical protein
MTLAMTRHDRALHDDILARHHDILARHDDNDHIPDVA